MSDRADTTFPCEFCLQPTALRSAVQVDCDGAEWFVCPACADGGGCVVLSAGDGEAA